MNLSTALRNVENQDPLESIGILFAINVLSRLAAVLSSPKKTLVAAYAPSMCDFTHKTGLPFSERCRIRRQSGIYDRWSELERMFVFYGN